MPIIRQLPPSVINKIAAGEVIERPASVVKELLENSVDAGATRIDVSLAGGGSDLIRVADNGCGMTADQLPLAIASHATSKIVDADDLFRVGSFGFRGEALASIAEVSQLTIRSRTVDSDAGAEIEVIGGDRRPVAPCGTSIGTTIEIRNLFYNTPVRRKFMRAVQTETSHCSEAFTRIALAHPRIHFTLRHNDRLLFDLPPTERWRERIAAFFGRDLEEALIAVDNQDGEAKLMGYVADPQHSRANNRMQYLFLNGRHIRDRALQHALSEAYRGLLLTGRFPIAFLRLELPCDAVDVNVHPTKLEVRFADSGRVYSLLLGTLRTKFLASDLTARVGGGTSAEDGQTAHDPAAAEQHRRELVEWAKGQLEGAVANSQMEVATIETDDATQSLLELQFDRPQQGPLQLTQLDRSWSAVPGGPRPGFMPASGPQSADSHSQVNGYSGEGQSGSAWAMRHDAHPPRQSHLGFQIHNRYLVTENEEGMVVIDQHALHERILYEQLREKVVAGKMETQRLLVPEPVSLAPAEAAAVLEAKETLGQLGIEIEPFGGDTLLVSSYPAMLANLGPAELLRQIVEDLVSAGKAPQKRDLLDELLHMIACKAAIKAGDRLTGEEITALLDQRHLCQDAHHCPHGRPTALVFTREELDRRFKRT